MCCDWLWVSLDSGRQKGGSEHVKKSKTLVSRADACCIIHWSHSHAGCSEPERIHTWAALLTGRVPVDRLISVEDCCLISVDAEGVS
jgi:hypothetical protein